MKRKEILFSRRQFICVCVPPISVLQISQLCALNAPISSQICPPHIYIHSHPNPSPPLSLQRLIHRSQHSFLCLNCAHHNRINDVPQLCNTSTVRPLVLFARQPTHILSFYEGGGFHFLHCEVLYDGLE
ncbi:hypothetical protein XENOCAPTIV_004718 [Xenoophorus captivus]|uniref:Uncharacterized protein n=1 Tax=Xenoophorus captivus TaxID=1517983 RepID=A0ABV0SGH1_9TELE